MKQRKPGRMEREVEERVRAVPAASEKDVVEIPTTLRYVRWHSALSPVLPRGSRSHRNVERNPIDADGKDLSVDRLLLTKSHHRVRNLQPTP